ncbi:hypothetical protein CG709_09595, partial [Lachnotalea glycerini]
MAFNNKKDKDQISKQPYTMATLLVQLVMTIMAILFIIPIVIVINYSFKTKKELYLSNPLSLPQSFNLENYKKAYDKLNMVTTFTNTFLYTLLSVVILAVLCLTPIQIRRGRRKERKAGRGRR